MQRRQLEEYSGILINQQIINNINMKKLLVASLSVIVLSILGTGCVKDKDFEDQQYGTQVSASRAVTFPQSRSSVEIRTGVVSSVSALIIQGPWIALESPNTESSDTHINLEINDALVTGYTGPGSPLTVLPTSEYSFDLARTIVAGQRFDSILINFPHSGNLDPNTTYGIGLRIVSADNGFQVAENMRELLLIFNVKNKYDGVYTASAGLNSTTGGFIDFVGGAAFTPRLPNEFYLETLTPTTCKQTRLVNSEQAPAYTFFNNGAPTFFGNYGLIVEFDPATDAIVSVHNYYGDPANPPTGVGDPSLGSGAPDYQGAPPRLRQATLDPSGVNQWFNNDGPDGPTLPSADIIYTIIQADVATFPGPRGIMDEHWERTGDRP